MRAIRWTLGAVLLLIVGAFLHYVLPKRDVIYVSAAESRIVSPDEVRGFRSLGATDATGQGLSADVFFIDGRSRDGHLREFRNEDTGIGFPPYFKFDSATLQNQAREAISASSDPNWQVVRYYGWRVPLLSMFPNAVSMRPAPSRDVALVPWFNIAFLLVVGSLAWAAWVRLRRALARRADPVAQSWDHRAAMPRQGGWRFWR